MHNIVQEKRKIYDVCSFRSTSRKASWGRWRRAIAREGGSSEDVLSLHSARGNLFCNAQYREKLTYGRKMTPWGKIMSFLVWAMRMFTTVCTRATFVRDSLDCGLVISHPDPFFLRGFAASLRLFNPRQQYIVYNRLKEFGLKFLKCTPTC